MVCGTERFMKPGCGVPADGQQSVSQPNFMQMPHVAIGSGDHLFAEDATRLAALGVWVTVVSRQRSLSQRLAVAACEVIFLDTLDTAAEVA